MKVGFFGTGLMGEPMAMRLIAAGYNVGVYNRTIEKTKNLEENSAVVFNNPLDLVEHSDLLICMLSDYSAIENVFLQIPPEKYSGKTILQMSTISPDENLSLAKFFGDAGCNFIEAPVLGSIPQVKSGELIVMVSSSKELFEEYADVFKTFGKKIILIGDYGKASALKLALNQLIATLTTAFSMSLGFVRENGVEVEQFMDILRNSALYAPTFDKKLDRMLERKFDEPNFPLKHLLKDVNLIIDSFAKSNIDTNTLEGVRKVIEKGITAGHTWDDYSSLYNAVHNK